MTADFQTVDESFTSNCTHENFVLFLILVPCCTKNFMHACSAMLDILIYNNAYAHLYTIVLLRVYTNNHHISSWDEVTHLLVMPMMCYSYNLYIYIHTHTQNTGSEFYG